MKNFKAIGLLLAALVLGLVAAVYAAGWVARQSDSASAQVVVAAVDVELGTRLTPQMLAVVQWPTGALPSGAFGDAAQLQDRVLRAGVLKGEPIVDRKLAAVGSQGGLSAVIAQGKRAMTVRVNDVVGVAGFALPGTFVDVMVNTRQDKGRGEEAQISKTVLEQVLVLAVAQESGRDDTQPKVVSAVTLELTPSDAEKLDLARSVGTLSLVLRNQIDRQRVSTAGTTKQQLLDARSLPTSVPARSRMALTGAPVHAQVNAGAPSAQPVLPAPALTPVPLAPLAPQATAAHTAPTVPVRPAVQTGEPVRAVSAAPNVSTAPSAVAADRAAAVQAAPIEGPCVEMIHNGNRALHCF